MVDFEMVNFKEPDNSSRKRSAQQKERRQIKASVP